MMIENGNWKVYIHTNRLNGKRYVGITARDPKKRWKSGYGYVDNKHFYDAIKKYGWDNFDHEIFADRLTEDEACNMEKILIDKLETMDYEKGYNMHKGGGIPPRRSKDDPDYEYRPMSETQKKKLSMIHKGMKASEETKKKMSDAHMNLLGQPILCVETGIVYPSIAEAGRAIGRSRADSSIGQVIRGLQQRAYGYHWKRLEKVS